MITLADTYIQIAFCLPAIILSLEFPATFGYLTGDLASRFVKCILMDFVFLQSAEHSSKGELNGLSNEQYGFQCIAF